LGDTAPPITGILTPDLQSGRINVEDPASTEEEEPYEHAGSSVRRARWNAMKPRIQRVLTQ